jgi:hypothetical protein
MNGDAQMSVLGIGQTVGRHSKVMTFDTGNDYMLNRTVRARQQEAVRDLGGGAAFWAGYEHQHSSRLPEGSR